MDIIEPDVFYSDVVLGLVLFIIAYFSRRHHTTLAVAFLVLGVSTWFGAWYHGFYNTTNLLTGKILWSATMTTYALSSLLFLRYTLPRFVSLSWVVGLLLIFFIFTTWINGSFFYGLILQGLAIVAIGIKLWHQRSSTKTLLYFFGFLSLTALAIYTQQAKLTWGLPYSHNTIFHVLEMPALVLLYLSLCRK